MDKLTHSRAIERRYRIRNHKMKTLRTYRYGSRGRNVRDLIFRWLESA